MSPMSSLVQNLCRQSQVTLGSTLRNQTSSSWDDSVEKLVALLSQLTLKDLNLRPSDLTERLSKSRYGKLMVPLYASRPPDPVSHVSVFENDTFSLTLFGLREKRSMIPLHDHPGMYAFMKCIYGSIAVNSYTILDDANLRIPDEILRQVYRNQWSNIVPTLYLGQEVLSSDTNKVASLTPFYGNLHEVSRVSEGLAVLADIISPPYTPHSNSFFYQTVGTIHDSQLGKPITWLLRTLDSNGFSCESVPYLGPNITVN